MVCSCLASLRFSCDWLEEKFKKETLMYRNEKKANGNRNDYVLSRTVRD